MEEPVPEIPPADAPKAIKDKYKKHADDSVDVGCLMLATICPELQKDLVHLEAYELSVHLKETFQQQVRQEMYETTKTLHSCKTAEGTSVSTDVFENEGLH